MRNSPYQTILVKGEQRSRNKTEIWNRRVYLDKESLKSPCQDINQSCSLSCTHWDLWTQTAEARTFLFPSALTELRYRESAPGCVGSTACAWNCQGDCGSLVPSYNLLCYYRMDGVDKKLKVPANKDAKQKQTWFFVWQQTANTLSLKHLAFKMLMFVSFSLNILSRRNCSGERIIVGKEL